MMMSMEGVPSGNEELVLQEVEVLLLKLGPRQLRSRLVASPSETVAWHYGMARSLERLGKKQEARSHTRAAVELDPTSARCSALRAWLELMTGPPDAATEDGLRRSAELSPAEGLPRRLLAGWLDSRGRTAEAIELLRAAGDDSDWRTRLSLAKLHAHAGHHAEARTELRSALERMPDAIHPSFVMPGVRIARSVGDREGVRATYGVLARNSGLPKLPGQSWAVQSQLRYWLFALLRLLLSMSALVLAVVVAWPILFVALAVMAYEDVLSWQLRAKRPGILDFAVPIVVVGVVFLARYLFRT